EAINSPSCSIPAGRSDHQVELLAMDRTIGVAGCMASKPKASLGEGMGLWSENASKRWQWGKLMVRDRASCGTANTSLIWGGCPRELLTTLQAMSGIEFPISHVVRHLMHKWMEALL
ncbi:hypothetical protein EV363DRAFT_1189563, partial [Boletus edulis]